MTMMCEFKFWNYEVYNFTILMYQILNSVAFKYIKTHLPNIIAFGNKMHKVASKWIWPLIQHLTIYKKKQWEK